TSLPPEVSDGDGEQRRRPELGRETEPEEQAADNVPFPNRGNERSHGEQRRPEVEAGVEERAEEERRDADREQRGPRAHGARADSAHRRRRRGDAACATDTHQHGKGGRVAPAHVRRQEQNGQSGRRIFEPKVAVRDGTTTDEPGVVDVHGDVRELSLLEPGDEGVERDREQDGGRTGRGPRRPPAHSTSNSAAIAGSSPISSGTGPRSGSSSP